ncbi:hypothetical protein M2165_000980 [Variovorax sp. TBS-050B]|uniref:flagellar hook-length control protein FliK n=1 Tax=Variovorax sp. TBS-050B TaxID=2940551 RepID=UPI002472F002|nr:flagellar hook-length control protein FliK [Variovorax sp. TBS-050B]MDH6591091.1 hypothetical protein [Variovorax sp. TBS-050B]
MSMNRPVGTHDATLSTKLVASRPDLAALQTEVGTSQPAGAVAEIQKVKNDVRLPSHAMLEARLPAAAAGPALPRADGPRSIETQWSVAARAIGAVLADLHAEAEPVRGTAPLWASAQKAPSAPVLAATLAQTLSGSGMFYESHLVEFATGLRTLEQLAEEPQMRLTREQPQQQQQQQPALGRAAPEALPSTLPQQPPALMAAARTPLPPASSVPMPAPTAATPPDVPATTTAAASPELALYNATARIDTPAAALHRAALSGDEAAAAPADRAAARELREAAGTPARATALEVIHPQTTALVHQQLDLLATAVFRWSGQAWPEVPMHWSIHAEAEAPADEDGEARGAPREDDGAAASRRWVTTVSLALPKLGAVDLRLSLMGEQVQARLAASEASTLTRLQREGHALAPRLEAAGLRLQDLQISAMAAGTAHAATEQHA